MGVDSNGIRSCLVFGFHHGTQKKSLFSDTQFPNQSSSEQSDQFPLIRLRENGLLSNRKKLNTTLLKTRGITIEQALWNFASRFFPQSLKQRLYLDFRVIIYHYRALNELLHHTIAQQSPYHFRFDQMIQAESMSPMKYVA